MFFSINQFTGDGTTTQWDINFAGGYIDQAHVKARSISPSLATVDLSLTFVGPNTVSISPAVPVGYTLEIYRDSPKDLPLVDFTDGAILNESNLDKVANQAIFVAAETSDRFQAVEEMVDDAVTLVTASAASATAAATSAAAAATSASSAATASAASAAEAAAAAEYVQSVTAEIGTYAALRAYNGDITAFYLQCAVNIFDGGYGVFRVDAADTTSADNGITIIVDAAGRRWRRDYVGDVYVKWSGARADGTTDSKAGIQAAINVQKVGGGKVIFDEGTYRTSGAVLLYSDVILQGAGMTSTYIKPLNSAVFTAEQAVVMTADFKKNADLWDYYPDGFGNYPLGLHMGMGVRDLTIDGNRASVANANGLMLYGGKWNLQNLGVINTQGHGIWTEAGTPVSSTSGDDLHDFINMHEAFANNVYTSNTNKHGWWYRGPNDSYINNVQVKLAGWAGFYQDQGLSVSVGNLEIGTLHAYSCTCAHDTDGAMIELGSALVGRLYIDSSRKHGVRFYSTATTADLVYCLFNNPQNEGFYYGCLIETSGVQIGSFRSSQNPRTSGVNGGDLYVRTKGNSVATLAIGAAGSGYTPGTYDLVVTGGGGYGATAHAVVGVGGDVTSVVLDTDGRSYTSVPTFALPAEAGAGTGSTFTATLDATVIGSVVVGQTRMAYGSGSSIASRAVVVEASDVRIGDSIIQGYSVAEAGTGATGTATVVGGAVTAVAITAGGTGYTNNRAVNIVAADGSGTQAYGKITVSGGAVTAVTVFGGGSGFTDGEAVNIVAASSVGLTWGGSAGSFEGLIKSCTLGFQYNNTSQGRNNFDISFVGSTTDIVTTTTVTDSDILQWTSDQTTFHTRNVGALSARNLTTARTDVGFAVSRSINAASNSAQKIGLLTNNITMEVPTNPTDGKWLFFQFQQDNVGGRTITWAFNASPASGYVHNYSNTGNTAFKRCSIMFKYDAGSGFWVQQGGFSGWF